jgi:Domain of Unknown Function (DUF1080)
MNRSRLLHSALIVLLMRVFDPMPVRAEGPDNALSTAEEKDGWILLFDGKSLDGWQTSSGNPGKMPVEEGCLNPHQSGGYMLIHKKTWADFVLSLDFKISKGCNSGVFIRTYPLTPRPGKDVGFNGIEVAVDDTKSAGLHDTGAFYDLVKPLKNLMKPPGQWNHMIITCYGPKLAVELNSTVTFFLTLWRSGCYNQVAVRTPHRWNGGLHVALASPQSPGTLERRQRHSQHGQGLR